MNVVGGVILRASASRLPRGTVVIVITDTRLLEVVVWILGRVSGKGDMLVWVWHLGMRVAVMMMGEELLVLIVLWTRIWVGMVALVWVWPSLMWV